MNTKHLLLLVLLLTVFSKMHAQKNKRNKERNNIASFIGGVSTPQGSFASTSGQDAGFASPGAVIDLIYQHRMSGSQFWITGAMRTQAWAFDVNSSSGSSTAMWTGRSLMFGGLYSIKLGGKVYFEPRVMVGLMMAKSPKISFGGSTIEPVTAFDVAYLIGPNFRFDLWPRVSLFLNADYMSAKPKFKLEVGGGSQTITQPMDNLNIAGGVGFRF